MTFLLLGIQGRLLGVNSQWIRSSTKHFTYRKHYSSQFSPGMITRHSTTNLQPNSTSWRPQRFIYLLTYMCYGLFSGAVSSSDFIASDQGMIKWKK